MRRTTLLAGIALVMTTALLGCARKTETVSEQSSDSLLASNPVEQPQGDLTPQTEYQPPQRQEPVAEPRPSRPRQSSPRRAPSPAPEPEARGVTLAAGTPIEVSVRQAISTEDASVGDTWTGEVTEAVAVGNTIVIPAGSSVTGVVNGVQAAQKGSRASLTLAVKSIHANGRDYPVSAGTESIVAGSTRARNLGAIAGGAAAGALIGKAVGGSGKGALVGGLIGAAGSGAAVAASKGYQVKLKEGTVLTFSVNQNIVVKT